MSKYSLRRSLSRLLAATLATALAVAVQPMVQAQSPTFTPQPQPQPRAPLPTQPRVAETARQPAIVPLTLPTISAPAKKVPPTLIHKIKSLNERIEMTVDTSKRLVLDQNIPEAQVANPDILDLLPLSPNIVQISAKEVGVTQVNLWGEDKKIYTINVIVHADARPLQMLLESQFPTCSLKVIPVGTSVMISGYVDQPEKIDLILMLADEYYPKVINAMTVSGVQQILLHTKVMEVSRTKMRAVGFDFSQWTGESMVSSSISSLLDWQLTRRPWSLAYGSDVWGSTAILGDHAHTFSFNIVDGNSMFLGVLEAIREDNLMKVLAEPTIVAISGRPARFLVGGTFYIVPQGLAAGKPMPVDYGVKIDVVAVVLGNGRINLEVRPEVSEIDRSVEVEGIPGLKKRMADTSVEMEAGQTFALAGLVSTRTESVNRGLPWISDLPYIGALFRRVENKENEVELVILITPELVSAMDCDEVPPCGPGSMTTNPSDWELYMKGHLEVPNCGPGDGAMMEPGMIGPGMMGPGGANDAMQGVPLLPIPMEQGIVPLGGLRPAMPDPSASNGRYHRYQQPKAQVVRRISGYTGQNSTPRFIGPVGYEVVK